MAVDQWRVVVEVLYRRRAEAFATASPRPLSEVYVEGSALLSADTAMVTALADAHQVLRGFAPTVADVTAADVVGDRAQLHLVDAWGPYDVVAAARPEGAALRRMPGRPAAAVSMVLVRSGDRWLIETAERTA